jgi:PAS domain S-box-containing protein
VKARRSKKRDLPRPGSAAGLLKRLRQTERRLRELGERYEIAMRAINESVYDWNIAGDCVYYSDSMEPVLALPPNALKSKSFKDWYERIHPDDFARFREATVAHLKGATERFECDYRYRALDGTWHWARTHGLAIRDKQGRAIRMTGSTGDITELKTSEERYALATSAAVEGIYEWNVQTGELFLSDRAKAFFAFPAEELTPAAWNRRIHGDDFPAYRAAIIDHFKAGTSHLEHEYRIADGRGGHKWVLDRGIGVRDAYGRVTKLVGALSDITPRKRAELELRRARDQAEEALEQQTATAEILKATLSSPHDVQQVFQAILTNASRLCQASFAGLFLYDGALLRNVARQSASAEFAQVLQRMRAAPSRETTTRRCALERRTIHTADLLNDPEYSPPEAQRHESVRTALSVPMLREGVLFGVITLWRAEVKPFTDRQIALVETFADQAVIAIENVRLFNETKEALERQTAMAEVLKVISGSPTNAQPVFEAIVDSCQRLFPGYQIGINLVDDTGGLYLSAARSPHADALSRYFERSATRRTGTSIRLRRAIAHYPDVEGEADVPEEVIAGCRAGGIKSIVFAPLILEGMGIGSLWVGRTRVGPFADKEITLLRTFADQAEIAIQNARLFQEIRDKSRQVEIANRHKTEFLANMSHELRTPLNAIIGFTRIVMRRSQEQLEPKQYENLEKILVSGQNLLALINAILDLSKVEAGRVEVNPAEVPLAPVLEQCLRTVEPLVKGDAVMLVRELDGAPPRMYVDEEKLRQIVINLLSNAAKFTARGSIRLEARAANGSVAIAVADTGIGIPADKLEVIFEEFEQADASSTRVHGGTGLGLTIARRLARLMGGDIQARSTPGSGSTFTLTLPVRYAA